MEVSSKLKTNVLIYNTDVETDESTCTLVLKKSNANEINACFGHQVSGLYEMVRNRIQTKLWGF